MIFRSNTPLLGKRLSLVRAVSGMSLIDFSTSPISHLRVIDARLRAQDGLHGDGLRNVRSAAGNADVPVRILLPVALCLCEKEFHAKPPSRKEEDARQEGCGNPTVRKGALSQGGRRSDAGWRFDLPVIAAGK